MNKKALIVWGGWWGHEPERVANRFAGWLHDGGFDVEISDTYMSFAKFFHNYTSPHLHRHTPALIRPVYPAVSPVECHQRLFVRMTVPVVLSARNNRNPGL